MKLFLFNSKALTFFGFFKKELRQALRDPAMKKFLFLIPILQLIFFGYALSSEVTNVRIYFDTQNSSNLDPLYKKFRRNILSTGLFIESTNKPIDLLEPIQRKEVDVVVVPNSQGPFLSSDVQLIINAQNASRAQSIDNIIRNILSRSLQSDGPSFSSTSSINKAQPLFSFNTRVLYNPELKSALFLVPGVMVMLINTLTIILVAMSIAREKESGTLETLLSAPIRTWEIILGKTVPFVLISFFNVITVMAVSKLLFQLPFRGSLFLFFLSSFIYILTTVSIGVLISAVAKNQQQSMMGGLLFLFPAFLLSGMMFPIETMPFALKFIAYLNPMSHYLAVVRNILLKGGSYSFVYEKSMILIATGVFCVYFALIKFKSTLNT